MFVVFLLYKGDRMPEEKPKFRAVVKSERRFLPAFLDNVFQEPIGEVVSTNREFEGREYVTLGTVVGVYQESPSAALESLSGSLLPDHVVAGVKLVTDRRRNGRVTHEVVYQDEFYPVGTLYRFEPKEKVD